MTQAIKTAVGAVIIAVVAGFAAVTLAATTHAQTIQNDVRCGSNLELSGGVCNKDSLKDANGNTNSDNVENLIKTVINILSAVVGAVSVIMIIIGGFRYITSAGDSNNVSGAKNTILYAIVGLVLVAVAQIIVQFVLERTTT